jgi:hypothetical protein
MMNDMRIAVQGTPPYPRTADAAPLMELAGKLNQLCAGLDQTGGNLARTAQTSSSVWTGMASQMFGQHMQQRASAAFGASTALKAAVPVLQTLAAAITTTQATYTVGYGLSLSVYPPTVAAGKLMMAGAVAGHQTAAAAAGSALVAIEAKLGALILKDIAADQKETGDTNPVSGLMEALYSPEDSGKAPGNAPVDGVPSAPYDTSRMPDTAGMTEEQKFDVYRQYFLANGIDISDPNQAAVGQRNILGLRAPTATTVNGGTGAYDDRIVVAWTEQRPNPNGGAPITVRRVEEFSANTEPSAQYDARLGGTTQNGRQIRNARDVGVDADFDGTIDPGRLQAGVHTFERSTSTVVNRNGENALRVRPGAPMERDVNHDGNFDQRDQQQIQQRMEERRAQLEQQAPRNAAARRELANLEQTFRSRQTDTSTILFHRGGDNNTWSAGCQTFRGRRDWDRFWGSLGTAQNQSQYRYVLRNVTN